MANSFLKMNSLRQSLITDVVKGSFDGYQRHVKTEWVKGGGLVADDFQIYAENLMEYLHSTETNNIKDMTNTNTSESMSSIATTLNKSENINDTSFNTKEINISRSNSQELENSNLIVSSSHTKKMNINQSNRDSISKREILLTSKLPISSQVNKMNHNCSEHCAWCKKCFAVLDNPNHIGHIRNFERQNAYLKIEPSLDIMACICDRCWNFLKKTYQSQMKAAKTTQRHIPHVPNNVSYVDVDNLDSVNGEFGIENAANVTKVDKELGTENLDKDDERAEVKNKAIVDGTIKVINTARVDEGSEVENKTEINEGFGLDNAVNKSVNHIKHNWHSKKKKRKQHPAVTCSVHNCLNYSIHPISSDEYIRINQIISQFDFFNIILIESKQKKLGMSSLSVCEEHLDMINVLTTCQLCGNELNGYLDSKEWKMHDEWNELLKCNNIPLILKPGMFICTSCQNYVSKCNTLSPNILENFRQNVKKRNNACRKSFGCAPRVNIPNIYQESNVDPLNDAYNKFDSPTKIKFSEPLTSTHYYDPYNSKHHSKTLEEKNKCHVHKVLDLLTVPEIKSTENINLNCDDIVDPHKLKIKSSDEEINSVAADSLLSDAHKKRSKISMSSYYLGKGRRKMPTKRTNRIMSLLKIPPYTQFNNKLLKNKYSLAKPTSGAASKIVYDNLNNSTENKSTPIQNVAAENQIFNDNINNFTKNKSTPIQNVAAEMDANKDLLPLHVCSLLDNNENKMSLHFEANKNQSTPINANSHLMIHKNKFGEIKDIKTEKIRKFSPLNTNIHSSQHLINIENNEFNQNSSEMTTKYSYHYVYETDESSDLNEDESSDLNEENSNNITENVVIGKPNEFDQRFCLLNSKNLHCMKPINRSELRQKLRNVIHQRITNGGIKKQKLNNTYELNENESCIYETNNSAEENSIDLIDDKSIIFQHLKVPTVSTLFPRIKENKNEIIDLLSDEDEGITSSTGDVSSIHIGECYSLVKNYPKRLEVKRTLQRVDDFYSASISAHRNLSGNETSTKDSQRFKIVYQDDSLNNQSNLNTTHSFNMPKIDSQKTKFARQHITINEEIEDLTQTDSEQCDSDNDENVIDVQLDESNRHIYENLLVRFNNNQSDITMHLMENYQMFYTGELILSENASTHASNSINYHLNRLYQIYGEPTMNNTTSVSFLPDSSECINDSSLNNITTTTSATYTPIKIRKLNSYPSTSSEITIISEDEESDT